MTQVLLRPERAGSECAPAGPGSAQVDELVRTHVPLAKHLAREVAHRVPAHVDFDELESAALFALVSSARSFDPSVGASFAGFAAIRIRGALTDELRSMDWASRGVRAKARHLDAARAELTERLHREPSTRELAAAAGMAESEVAAVRADAHRASVQSLHALAPEGGLDTLAEPGEGPEALLVRHAELEEMRSAVQTLPNRLRFVIEEYFFAQRRMADIAAELGVTESRISQLRSEALRTLRRTLLSTLD